MIAAIVAAEDHLTGRQLPVVGDVEEVPDIAFLEDLQDLAAVLLVGLVPRAQQSRGRGSRHLFQVVSGFLGEVDKILIDNPAHPVDSSVDPCHLGKFARLQGDADERLIDDRRGPTALGNQNLSFEFGHDEFSLL